MTDASSAAAQLTPTDVLGPFEEYLRERAVPVDVAIAAGLRCVDGREAAKLLGRKAPITANGLAMPYPGINPAYVRIRFAEPVDGAKMLCPAGRDVPVYQVPAAARELCPVPRPTALDGVIVVVESAVKALAVTAAGVEVVGLAGTGTTLEEKNGARRLNGSWAAVGVADKDVIICMDAGRATNPNVARDEARLAQALRGAGAASVSVASLPPTATGDDQGPDDFIAASGPQAFWTVLDAAVPADPMDRVTAHVAAGRPPVDLLDDLPFLYSVIEASTGTAAKAKEALAKAGVGKQDIKAALKQAQDRAQVAAASDGPTLGDHLAVVDGRICTTPGGAVPLCNFDAKILEERVVDDGAEKRRSLVIAGTLESGVPLPRVVLAPDDLGDPLWAMKEWGTVAKIASRKGTTDDLRLAMQLFSTPVLHTAYSHTGWRKLTDSTGVESGLPVFLNGNGAIGATGVSVELPDRLAAYALPTEPEDVAEAVRTSLKLLELGPFHLMVTLLALTYRAPLQSLFPADFAAFVYGKTGSLKTAVTKLATAHYGVALAETPITSFEASVAHIEMVLHRLKDVLVLVDDFKPASTHPKDEHQTKARHLFSSVGNQEGRGRMRADGSARQSRPPRGLVIATGEMMPSGESTVARTLALPLARNAVNTPRLSTAQANAEALPHALSAYLKYLQPRLEGLAPEVKKQHGAFRERFRRVGEAAHLRSPSALAHVALGLEMFWPFAVEVGALSPVKAKELGEHALEQLDGLCTDATSLARETDPALRFVDNLRSRLTQSSILTNHNTAEPLANRRGESSLIGEWVGWHDRDFYYLLGEATYAAVVRGLPAGEGIPLGERALWKRLRDQGLIEPGDRDGRLTRRVQLGGQRTDVIVMRTSVLFPDDDGGSGGPGGTGGPTSGGAPAERAPESDNPDFSTVGDNRTTDAADRTNSDRSRTSGAAGSGGAGEAQPAGIAAPLPPVSRSAGPVGTVGTVEKEEKSIGGADSSITGVVNESVRALVSIPPGTGPTGPTAQTALTCGDDVGSSRGASSAPKTEVDQPDQRARSVVADGLAFLRKTPAADGRRVFCLKTAKRLLGDGAVTHDDYARHAELADRVGSAGLAEVAELEFDLLPVIAAMEKAGVGIDVAAWAELVARAEEDVAQHAAVLAAYGLATPADDSQVRKALRSRGVDQPSTSWKALAPHMADPFVVALVGYRRTAGFLNSVGRAVLDSANRSGGRVHAAFDPLAAPTGRMSCANPNLLAIPKASEYRRCVTPAPGHLLVVADYAAIELRVLAALTGDEALTRVFAEGSDPHAATAAALLTKNVADVSKQERQRAKAVNFGFAFGMGPARFVEYAFGNFGLAISLKEAVSMRAAFLTAYTNVAVWQRRIRNAMPLEVRTRAGRRRVFTSPTAEYCERLNTPVQGTAADGLKHAMVLLHERLRGTGARLVLAVHDELLVEAPEHRAAEVREVVEKTMVEAMARFIAPVPVKVEASVRRSWAE